MTDFTDRFASETYLNDEGVTVSVGELSHVLPERLFARAQLVAEAYNLHLLPSIELYSRTSFNPEQCATLVDELAFIRSVLSDTLLQPHVYRLLEIAEQCRRSHSNMIIEGP